MLDKRLNYTCGYWKNAAKLDEAQEAKLDLVCKKIGLKEGMDVLEFGCGWGSFAKFAAEKYGAHVVGVTISKEQLAFAQEVCKGLPVELRFQDYRDVHGKFDAIISIGMLEHVGYKNYGTYMQVVDRCLKDDGVALIHCIGNNQSMTMGEAWGAKYIFPNGMLPSIAQLGAAMEPNFVMEDWHNYGPHYDPTLLAWNANFEKAWPGLKEKYGERFRRMWRYYLLNSAGAFRARAQQLWQIVFTRKGTPQPECRFSLEIGCCQLSGARFIDDFFELRRGGSPQGAVVRSPSRSTLAEGLRPQKKPQLRLFLWALFRQVIQNLFHLLAIGLEGSPTRRSELEHGVRSFAFEEFFYFEITCLFKLADMGGKVAPRSPGQVH